MNIARKNTRQTVGVISLCLLMLARGGLSIQVGAGTHQTAKNHVKPKHTGKSDTVVYAAISPDGRMGASFYGKNAFRLWDKRTGKLLRTIKYVHSDDERYRFTGGENFQFSRTGKWLLIKTVYSLNLSSVEPHHEGESLDVWNTSTGREIPTPIRDVEDTVRCVAFTPNDTALVYDCIGKFGSSLTLYKVDLTTNKYQELNLYSESDINSGYETTLTPDGKTYRAVGFGPERIVDVATFKSTVLW